MDSIAEDLQKISLYRYTMLYYYVISLYDIT
jgi:hypothetical protein